LGKSVTSAHCEANAGANDTVSISVWRAGAIRSADRCCLSWFFVEFFCAEVVGATSSDDLRFTNHFHALDITVDLAAVNSAHRVSELVTGTSGF